jgi:dienelactone hydrolase
MHREGGAYANDQTKDAFGALDYLAGLPFVDGERVAVMGFSAGAFAINEILIGRSRQRTGMHNYKAAISLYGRCSDPLRTYSEKDIPLVHIIGELDAWREICEGEWMKSRPIEVHVLKGAYNSFDHPQITTKRLVPKFWFPDPQDNPMLYDAAKTREARELTRAFLAKHL